MSSLGKNGQERGCFTASGVEGGQSGGLCFKSEVSWFQPQTDLKKHIQYFEYNNANLKCASMSRH